jgi:2'-5' RNA ligase
MWFVGGAGMGAYGLHRAGEPLRRAGEEFRYDTPALRRSNELFRTFHDGSHTVQYGSFGKASRAAQDWEPTGDGEEHVGVFLPLPASLDTKFPDKSDRDSSAAHITVLYVGKLPKKDHQEFLRLARKHLSGVTGPAHITGSAVDYFDNDDKNDRVPYVVPKVPAALKEARQKLVQALEKAGIEVSAIDKDEWTPHVTLAYLKHGEDWDGDIPELDFHAAELEVWGLPDVHRIKM